MEPTDQQKKSGKLAERFEAMAREAQDLAQHESIMAHKIERRAHMVDYHVGKQHAFEEAARMLRNSEVVS